MPMLDLNIRNGTVVNGTGAPAFVGDVGVRAGRIVAVGAVDDDAAREIDATGLVVCPGFIDTHTHYDAQLNWDPLLSPSSWFGVTTVVMGNCGFALAPCRAEDRRFLLQTLQHVEGIEFRSSWPALRNGDWGYETFPEYLDFLDAHACSVNLVAQIGHTALRTWVMGPDAATSRVATDDELARMGDLVTEALDHGAVGLSTSGTPGHCGIGGLPVPSRWADEREFLALAHAVMRARHGRLQGVLGNVFNNPFLLRLMEETGIPVCEITPTRQDHVRTALGDLGYEIWGQLQVIPGSMYTGLHDPFYFAINMPGGGGFNVPQLYDLFGPVISMKTHDELLEYYRADDFRDRFVADTDVDSWNRSYWPAIEVARAPGHPEWEDRRIVEVAQAAGLKPAEVVYEVCVASDLAGRIRICFGNHADKLPGLETLRRFDDFGLGLHDAGAHLAQISTACWPGRLLGPFVREGGLPLERAVQHATSLSAAQFGILDRGLLLNGQAADIVVFDPVTIRDGPAEEVDDLPEGATRLVSEPIGIEYVVVNGTVTREHNKDAVDRDGPLPGKVLREFRPNPRHPEPRPVPQWIRDEVDAEWEARVARVMQITGGNPPPDPAQPGRFLV
jgi:N-acyl-D-aspartate/D-glutamate deacylase